MINESHIQKNCNDTTQISQLYITQYAGIENHNINLLIIMAIKTKIKIKDFILYKLNKFAVID